MTQIEKLIELEARTDRLITEMRIIVDNIRPRKDSHTTLNATVVYTAQEIIDEYKRATKPWKKS